MLQIDQLTDVKQLKQVTTLLLKENENLHKRLIILTRELAQLRGTDQQIQLELEIAKLEQQLDRFQKRLFAPSTEKRSSADKNDESEPEPRRGHGPREQKELPVVEVVHELGEEDRQCPICAGELSEMKDQFEESEEITIIRRRFLVEKQLRQKYRCRCNGAVVTAPGPVKLQAGGRYSVAFAVDVAVAKYGEHMPLDRQRRVMADEGLDVTTSALWDQIEVLAKRLKPSYRALQRHVLSAPLIGADETWWRVMGGESKKKWWDWCFSTREAVVHTIHKSRSAEAVKEILDGYEGTLMTDGYQAYQTLARAGPEIRLVHCWAHVRRKFVEMEKFYPGPCKEILDLIGKLYQLEKTVPDLAGENREEALRLRGQVRQKKSKAVIQEIRDWAFEQKASPESGLRKAVEYMLKLWPGLTRFLEDPAIPLDNNATERALRGVVLGRKNHLGSRSVRGTKVAALFYSLIETAKLCGVEPRAYLLKATKAVIEEPGTALLPHELVASAGNETD